MIKPRLFPDSILASAWLWLDRSATTAQYVDHDLAIQEWYRDGMQFIEEHAIRHF